MDDSLRFVYSKEYWYISAFINTKEFIGESKAEEIEALLLDRLKNLNDNDLEGAFKWLEKYPYPEEKKQTLVDMTKSVSIECDWEPFFQNFPYTDENNPYTEDNEDLIYNTLGYFKFEVEYYKDEPYKKEKITPDLIQQIPIIVKDIILKEFSKRKENEFLLLDTESPIYVFVISNKILPMEIQWTQENIHKYRKVLGYWIRIYSGQWIDYNEELFERRIKNNFSNRLSELHYIHRNSGFIYMPERTLKTEFPYIKQCILDPTPKLRAVLFALMTINNSLDVLFMKRYSDMFMSLEKIEEKTKNLRFLRGMIQTKMSLIYSELDWNPRQHYTRVLTHLINGFRIPVIIERVDAKFNMLYETMQELYIKKNEETQKRTKRVLSLVNIFLGAGIIADLVTAVLAALTIPEGNPVHSMLNTFAAIVIGIILISTLIYVSYSKIKTKELEQGFTVDAVIQDDNQNIILIKRKYAPHKGKYALPGGFIKFDEDPNQAVIREVREETNLAVKIIEKIGVYDQPGRDPRGDIISTAYKCR
ncbi:MAG: NUDIX domain-containing protein, partial [Promethearchaeota archaeon]